MTAELKMFFSPSRMASYQLPGETWEVGFVRYQWNIRLAEALVPAFNYFEVGLRNGINRSATAKFGADWLLQPTPAFNLSAGSLAKIQNTKEEIWADKGRNPSHDDLVARLGFGFWTGLFHKRHAVSFWHKPNTIPLIFPYMPRRDRDWKSIADKVYTIKALRNRIAHHEPIMNTIPSPESVHQTCTTLIQAMSREAAEKLASIDRFQSIWKLAELD